MFQTELVLVCTAGSESAGNSDRWVGQAQVGLPVAQRMKRDHPGKKWRKCVPERGNSICKGPEDDGVWCLGPGVWDLFKERVQLEVK